MCGGAAVRRCGGEASALANDDDAQVEAFFDRAAELSELCHSPGEQQLQICDSVASALVKQDDTPPCLINGARALATVLDAAGLTALLGKSQTKHQLLHYIAKLLPKGERATWLYDIVEKGVSGKRSNRALTMAHLAEYMTQTPPPKRRCMHTAYFDAASVNFL